MKEHISWMRGSFGVSSHYTQAVIDKRSNGAVKYSDAIDALNVEKIADALSQMGCTHYIFTLTHAKQYLPFPCETLNKILGGRTSKRDFLRDLIDALKAKEIRLILYYNHSCNGNDDVLWKEACSYAEGGKDALDKFAENIWKIDENIKP